jgi:hypothetical protein
MKAIILKRSLVKKMYTKVNCSPDIIRAMKLRRMGWAGHVAHMGEMRNAYKMLVGKPERKRRKEDLGVGWRIILKSI